MDELGKSIPAAEAMVDAEHSGKRKHPNEFCLNCGTKLEDAWCHHCGQKDIPRRQTLGELLSNFISSFWSYEGKFFQTTKYLITRPGFLAIEYNEGRRERYYHPARMYVFISFVFFLLYVSIPDEEKITNKEMTAEDKEELEKVTKKIEDGNVDSIFNELSAKDTTLKKVFAQPWMDSVKATARKNKNKKNQGWNMTGVDYKTVKAYDSAQNLKAEKDRDGWFVRRMTVRGIELKEKYSKDENDFSKDFSRAFSDNFSKVLFYLLPVFALLLWLLYIRRDYFYSEHLVFTIYYYNFFFLAGSAQMLLNLVPWLGWLASLLGFWIYFYMLFAMKRMYGQPWGKTILKFVIFSGAFFMFALLGISINAIVTLMIL